jgi:hypothetical protein
MRAHGVPNFPDLRSTAMQIEGNGPTMSVNGVALDAPAYRAARTQCERYLPSMPATQVETAQSRQRGLEFARCMRSHGAPNFPDPKLLPGVGGNQEAYLPGVNPQSPAIQTAAKACGGGPKGP